jgi:hypothetical protein
MSYSNASIMGPPQQRLSGPAIPGPETFLLDDHQQSQLSQEALLALSQVENRAL